MKGKNSIIHLDHFIEFFLEFDNKSENQHKGHT